MGLGKYDKEVSSGGALYADSFDDSIEQSAIYNQVFFECVGQNLPAIVLTPRCDILHPRGELLLTVSGVFPASIVFEEFLRKKGLREDQIAGLEPTPKSNYRGFPKEFKDYYLKNRTLEFHFLPAYKDKLPHSFVDFRVVKTLLSQELDDKNKIAVLISPWRESVPARYAAYSLRVGVADFATEFLEAVIGEISTLSVSS
jgi:hypothetical protein